MSDLYWLQYAADLRTRPVGAVDGGAAGLGVVELDGTTAVGGAAAVDAGGCFLLGIAGAEVCAAVWTWPAGANRQKANAMASEHR
jgi:hypothetical protein